MKKLFYTSILVFAITAVQAQTSTHKNYISAGGGIEQYNGDLGNSFFDFEEECHGFYRFRRP